ncbi:MAG: alpha/beta hydrolase [Solirubrobacterales bacterium]|nr:alpha/beta hydrolase [Solirubrobacterales bacterium]
MPIDDRIEQHTSSWSGLELLEVQPDDPDGRTPVLFVHGAGHGAWCWENWLTATADAGHPAYALSLSGHGGSGGSLLRSHLGTYADEVIRTAASLPRQPVIVGHSLGGLVVQKAIARYPARAAVLVAPIAARPGLLTLAAIARRHPGDAAKVMAGGSLPMREDYLFEELEPEVATGYSGRCGNESPWAQFQVLLHLPARPPKGGAPVLVLGTPDDALIPIDDVRDTARRYDAELIEFPGIGHDLMLDRRWAEPAEAMLGWIDSVESIAEAA